MNGFLLDTTVLIQHWRSFPSVLAWVEQALAEEPVFTTAVNVAEIYAGAHPAERSTWARFFAQMSVLTIDSANAALSGQLRYDQARRGRTLQLADSLVAAVALQQELSVVTANTKDFVSLGLNVIELS